MKHLFVRIKVPAFPKLRAWLAEKKPTVLTRKRIIYKFLKGGSTALGWLALQLTRALFWDLRERDFIGHIAMRWTHKPVYSDKIAGIDKALKDNYSPEKALDRLKAEHDTLNSFIQFDNEP